jgi:hypothetical protein
MVRTFSIVLVLLISALPVVGQVCLPSDSCTYFWLSTTANPASSGLPANSSLVPDIYGSGPGGTGSIYIWGRSSMSPDLKLQNFSLNLRADSTAVTFTNSVVYNDPTTGPDHWQHTGQPAGTTNVPNVARNILGLSFTNSYLGIGNGATGSSFYNGSIGAWLVARVDFLLPAARLGTTDLRLEIGSYGMNYQGLSSLATDVVFGSAGDQKYNAGIARETHNYALSARDGVLHFLDADFDNDNDVDPTDLAIWQTGYGIEATTHAQGDTNGDGKVNGNDFLVWQRQFSPPLGGLSTLKTVPEPYLLGPAVWAVLAMLMTRRRRYCPLFGGNSSLSSASSSSQRIQSSPTCVHGWGNA